MKLFPEPTYPVRCILCTCVLKTHQKGELDQCPHWLCICGNTSDRLGFAPMDDNPENYWCLRCSRQFNKTTGLLIPEESQLRLEMSK